MACQRKECNKACRDQNGYTHQVGDRFLSGQNGLEPCVWFDLGRWKNECNSCSCLSGGVVKCSKDQCTKKCKDEQGYTHQVGDQWTSQCKSCTCGSGGKVSCRQTGCKNTCTDERGFVHQVRISWQVPQPTESD